MIKKRNFKSIVAVGVIALASATLLAACGSKSTSSKDEINWYTPTEILTLDISKNTDHYSANFGNQFSILSLIFLKIQITIQPWRLGTQKVTYFVLIKMGSCNLIWLKRLMYQLMV